MRGLETIDKIRKVPRTAKAIGMYVGPAKLRLVKEVAPEVNLNGQEVRTAKFLCNDCNQTFEASIGRVCKGKQWSCIPCEWERMTAFPLK